jgi:hypothetical protein
MDAVLNVTVPNDKLPAYFPADISVDVSSAHVYLWRSNTNSMKEYRTGSIFSNYT